MTDRFSPIPSLAAMQPGAHLCCLYASEAEQRAALASFLMGGIAQNQKIIYIIDAPRRDATLNVLAGKSLDIQDSVASGQLVWRNPQETFLRSGTLDPQDMLALLSAETDLALAEGYTALRVASEMSWVMQDAAYGPKLIDYETQLNNFYPGSHCLGMCQYNRRSFNSDLLIDVLLCHSRLLLGGEVFENFYYVTPEAMFGREQGAARLEQWLQNVTERNYDRLAMEHARQSLEQHAAELDQSNQALEQEIARRQQVEAELRESEARYRLLVEDSPNSVGLFVNDKLNYLNPAGMKMMGYEKQADVIGKRPIEFVAPEDRQEALLRRKSLLHGQNIPPVRQNFIRQDGSRVATESIVTPTTYQGQPAVLVISTDISDQIRIEQYLQQSRETYAQQLEALSRTIAETLYNTDMPTLLNAIVSRAVTLCHSTSGGLYLMQPDGESIKLAISYRHPVDFTGYILRLGEGVSGRVAQSGQLLVVNNYADWEGHAAIYEKAALRRVMGVPLKANERVLGVINISDYERTDPYTESEISLVSLFADQAALAIEHARLYQSLQYELIEHRQAEIAYRSLVDQSLMAVGVIQDDRLVFANQAAEGLFGTSAEQLSGMTLAELAPKIYATDRRKMLADIEQIRQGKPEPIMGRYRVVRAENDIRCTEVVGRAFEFRGRFAILFVAIDVTERVLAEQSVESYAHQLEALSRTTAETLYSLEIPTLLNSIVERAAQLCHCDNGELYLLEEDDETLEIVASYNHPGEMVGKHLVKGEGLSWRAVLEDKPWMVTDYHRWDGRSSLWDGDLFQRALSVPLKVGTQIIGALSLSDYESSAPFTDQEVRLVTLFAAQAALAIERARLYQTAQGYTQHLEALSRTTTETLFNTDIPTLLHDIIARAAALVQCEIGDIYTVSADGDSLENQAIYNYPPNKNTHPPMKRGVGLVGRALQKGQPIAVSDYHTWEGRLDYWEDELIHRSLAVPLKANDVIIGVLCLNSYSSIQPFTEKEINLVSLFADQAALAIEHARLYQALKFELEVRRQAEAAYRSLVDQSLMGVTVLQDDKLVFANQAAVNIYRVSPETLNGMTYGELFAMIHPDDRGRAEAGFQRIASGEETSGASGYRLLGGENDVRWVEMAASRFEYQNRPAVLIAIIDVTDRILAEKAVQTEREKARLYMNIADVIMLALDERGCVTTVNRKACEVLGYREEQVLGKDWFKNFIPGPYRRKVRRVLQRLLHGDANKLRVYENPILTASGEERLVSWHNSVIRNAEGKATTILSSGEDITERRLAEEALVRSEDRYRALTMRAPVGIYETDPQGNCLFVNQRWQEITGYSQEEARGRGWMRIFPPDERPNRHPERTYQPQAEERDLGITRLNTKSGQEVWVSVRLAPLKDARGNTTGFLGTVTDITPQRKLEEALRQRAAQLAALQENVLDITTPQPLEDLLYVLLERAVRLIDARAGVLNLFDYERQEMHCVASFDYHRDYRGTTRSFREGAAGRVAITGEPMIIDNYNTWDGRLPDLDDEERTLNAVIEVPLKIAGSVIGALELVDDSNVRKFDTDDLQLLSLFAQHAAIAFQHAQLHEQAELEIAERSKAEAQLTTSLAEKEVILREIHHRVKNNLNVIISLIELQIAGQPDIIAVPFFHDLESRVRSMALVHENLYQSTNLSAVDFREYIANLVGYLHSVYLGAQAIDIRLDIAEVALSLEVAVPCGLLINELLSNSFKYAFPTQKGTLAERKRKQQVWVSLHTAGDHLELTVADNGIGLPQDLDWRNTSSLGLQLVNILAGQIGGQITVDNSHGAAFTLVFPRKDE